MSTPKKNAVLRATVAIQVSPRITVNVNRYNQETWFHVRTRNGKSVSLLASEMKELLEHKNELRAAALEVFNANKQREWEGQVADNYPTSEEENEEEVESGGEMNAIDEVAEFEPATKVAQNSEGGKGRGKKTERKRKSRSVSGSSTSTAGNIARGGGFQQEKSLKSSAKKSRGKLDNSESAGWH